MARRVAIVPHTHWDREWYAPFQSFRLRLVDLLDGLLDHLDADPSYSRFLLDGQLAVVDDYLEVRPDEEERLRRLAGSGRLSVGPWYVLMDEFLVSGETIVRNLQRGLRRGAAFGGAMPVGYLPDMFGHVAQMPQILRLAGMEHAVVWRGVPSAVDRTAFWWSAPDGSTVRAEYLVTGYGNGSSIHDDAKVLVGRLAEHERELAPFLVDGLLYMNGTDHEMPQPWLGRVVAEANDIQQDYELVITSLPEYLAGAPTDGLPRWEGELRSGARANLLMGVASNRVDVKQAAARAERALERVAEPLAALHLPPSRWPAAVLDLAWREVIRNSAHDSICACSVDEVCDAVLHRYAEARQIADGVALAALGQLGGDVAHAGPVAVNPSPHPRSGLVEVLLRDDAPAEGTQLLEERPEVVMSARLRAAELAPLLAQLRSQQIDEDTFVNAVDVDEDEDGLHIVARADDRLRDNLLVEELKAGILRRVEGRPDLAVHLRVEQEPRRRVLARVDHVDGYGWAPVGGGAPAVEPVVARGGTGLGNGRVSVEVDPSDGTFAINGLAGFDRLVDDGDLGDTYNYGPPPGDLTVARPDEVEVAVEEAGPLRGRLRVIRRFRWPAAVVDGARAEAVPVEVVTRVELRAGDPLVRVHTTWDNRYRDHRVRSLFPLPRPAAGSFAECAFAVVERGLRAEGGPTERALATYPSRRFVHAGGLTVFHDGLLEYQLVDPDGAEPVGPTAGTLALTLLRATGMLSRVELAYRPLPAGPPIAMEGPQMQGPVEARYALWVADHPGRDWSDLYRAADDALVPLLTTQGSGAGTLPPDGSALTVTGGTVSSVRRVDGALEVRVFNPSPDACPVELPGRAGWSVDLRGRPGRHFADRVVLDPWEIRTLRLTGGEPGEGAHRAAVPSAARAGGGDPVRRRAPS